MSAIAQDRVVLERTIQAHRKEIDRQPGNMQTLHEEVAQLSRSLNATSFVSRLPREVIYPIFWEYLYNSQEPFEVQAFTESNVHDARGSRPPHWQWLLLTRVCYSWRTIALSSPTLRSQLDARISRYPSILEIFIPLSREAPLDVTMISPLYPTPHDSNNIIKALPMIIQEATRLRSLKLVMGRVLLDSILTCYTLLPSLSHLKYLYISAYQNKALMDQEAISLPLPLFPMFMKANLQSLHHLSIIHVAVDWSLMLHFPPTMSYLAIINISQHSVHSMRDVLSVLRQHPQLRTLYLCVCLPQPTHESVDSVYLPKLEELILMQTDPSSIYLLESLVLPPDTWISTGFNFFHGRFLAAFFSYIKRMANNVQSKITDASIAIESDSEYVGNAMIVGLGRHGTRLSTITVLPACDNIEPPFSLLSFLRDVTHSASPRTLSSLNYLHISINDWHYPDITPSFLHLLESVDNLEDLTIEGLGGVLLDILRLPQCKSTLVPNLRHLRLSKVKVVEDIKSHRVGSLDSNVFCEWLEERQACGLGIVTLTIGKGCKLHVSEPVQLHCKLLALVTEIKEWERLLK